MIIMERHVVKNSNQTKQHPEREAENDRVVGKIATT